MLYHKKKKRKERHIDNNTNQKERKTLAHRQWEIDTVLFFFAVVVVSFSRNCLSFVRNKKFRLCCSEENNWKKKNPKIKTIMDGDHESILLIKHEVFVYKIPPAGSNRKHRYTSIGSMWNDWFMCVAFRLKLQYPFLFAFFSVELPIGI